jgi:hypothetical protein
MNEAQQTAYLKRWHRNFQRNMQRVGQVDKTETPAMIKMRCLATRPWVAEDAELRRFTVNEHQAMIQMMRAACNPHRPPRFVPAGEYWQLLIDGGVMMTDTPDEKIDHLPAFDAAERIAQRGDAFRCLVNGFGLGLVTNALLEIPEVEHVTVVELNPDVIKHMAHYTLGTYGSARVTVVHADAFDYQPPKGERFGVVWHDIWPSMSPDNLPEMHRLHRKYGRRTEWQGSWCRSFCEAQRRYDKRMETRYAEES